MIRRARTLLRAGLAALAATLVAGCGDVSRRTPGAESQTSAGEPAAAAEAARDEALEACEASWKVLEATAEAPGAPELRENRIAFLGRARGAATLLVRAPAGDESEAAKKGRERIAKDIKGTRVTRFVASNKHDRAALRSVVLREGYLWAEEPEDAFELEARVKLTELFDASRLVLDRGEETFVLEHKPGKHPEYLFADGPRKGKAATIMFLDRVRAEADTLGEPLHRDILAFARRAGFDRMEVVRLTERGMLTRLRYGETWARAVVDSKGAKLELSCLAEPEATRKQVDAHLAETAWRRRAQANMRGAVSAMVDDALPFDRPRDEKTPDKDGSLRPYWISAYLRGQHSFEVDEQTYAVFLPDGRPHPPSVCVDFVLESYERAAGSWFAPRGEKPRRVPGRLDFDEYDPKNNRGVLGFGEFAEEKTDLFEFRKFSGAERIPFQKREAFFGFLLEHANEFRPGDVLAIHGLKRDERVHQHAILLEELDPLTGFPSGLADHMKNPRRRTWEGIMAEAPKRSLLFRARPKDVIVQKLDDGVTVADAGRRP